MTVRKLKLDLSLVRGHSTKGTHVSLQMIDHNSWSSIRIEMTPAQLGSLMANESQTVTVNFYNPQNLGKQRLRKSIKHVFKTRAGLPYEPQKRDAMVRKLAEPYEKDGWMFAGPHGSWSQSDTGFEGTRAFVMLHFVKYVKKVVKPKNGKGKLNVNASK